MPAESPEARLKQMTARLDRAQARLAEARDFAKSTQTARVLDITRRVMLVPGGIEEVYSRIAQLEQAGIFSHSDWAQPDKLQPAMAANTIRVGNAEAILLECLSELRLASVACGLHSHSSLSAEQATRLITQILALNLRLIFRQLTESERLALGPLAELVQTHYEFVARQIGFGDILEQMVDEIWRILAQRPVQVEHVKDMITSVAVCLSQPDNGIEGGAQFRGAERLISALYGPTRGCQEDPGLKVYQERLATMDQPTLRNEALGFGRAMHDTGLVSPYHPLFLRFLRERHDELIPEALGLSSTGTDALSCYRDLVYRLIDDAVWPETAQAVYGLAGILERGILYSPPLAPALWRQINLQLCPAAIQRLGGHDPASVAPRVRLLAAILNVLGQPLGVGQGNNPTCQSARALSMWSSNDPDYLLQLVAWAARDNDVVMHFEGQAIHSGELVSSLPSLSDVDPLSVVIVPHLDAIYHAMGRLCAGRLEDPHRWINPEFHGWWVGHGFAIAVDVATGQVQAYEDFLRLFYACYHPLYNGNNPVIHPQPAGIAVTDSAARFMGWHAISIQRVGLDPTGAMRVYFFNPNNDSGQDWGGEVRVSTAGCGERFGEASLPFAAFTSRLYIFYYDPREVPAEVDVPPEELSEAIQLAATSWARDRQPPLPNA